MGIEWKCEGIKKKKTKEWKRIEKNNKILGNRINIENGIKE